MNKASGGDGIPAELFHILNDDALKVIHLIYQQIWKTQQWPQDWKMSVFIPIPKKGNDRECSNDRTTALISHASKVMLKILQARLQQYVNHELQNIKLDLEKAQEPEIKLPTSVGSQKKQDTCLLQNLCVSQGATVRTGHGTMVWFQTGKGMYQGYILSPFLFNLYAEYIM